MGQGLLDAAFMKIWVMLENDFIFNICNSVKFWVIIICPLFVGRSKGLQVLQVGWRKKNCKWNSEVVALVDAKFRRLEKEAKTASYREKLARDME